MNIEEKKAYRKAYYEVHKEERKAYSKAYRKANREKERAYKKGWYRANKGKIRESMKVWYQGNSEKIKRQVRRYYQANKEKEKVRSKAWREANPEKRREKNRKHRALKHTTQIEPINEKMIFMRDGWICQHCKKRVDKRLKHPNPMSASLDHITPLSKGGKHIYSNVQLAHFSCNSSKKDRVLPQGEQTRLF